jgi:hypothetical protein
MLPHFLEHLYTPAWSMTGDSTFTADYKLSSWVLLRWISGREIEIIHHFTAKTNLLYPVDSRPLGPKQTGLDRLLTTNNPKLQECQHTQQETTQQSSKRSSNDQAHK